jgi:phosphoserine phosphatase
MNIFIVRHGETEWNTEEIFRGTKDIPLNGVGIDQAERTGDYFIDKRIENIFSSPLSRAHQTAEAISRSTKKAIATVDGFTDINFGEWEGRTVKDVELLYPQAMATWREHPQRLRVSGGETLSQVKKRAAKALGSILPEAGENIVIVTHRVLCKILMLHFLKVSNQHFWEIKFDPAGISLVVLRDGTCVVGFMNDTCHLKGDKTRREYSDF